MYVYCKLLCHSVHNSTAEDKQTFSADENERQEEKDGDTGHRGKYLSHSIPSPSLTLSFALAHLLPACSFICPLHIFYCPNCLVFQLFSLIYMYPFGRVLPIHSSCSFLPIALIIRHLSFIIPTVFLPALPHYQPYLLLLPICYLLAVFICLLHISYCAIVLLPPLSFFQLLSLHSLFLPPPLFFYFSS